MEFADDPMLIEATNEDTHHSHPSVEGYEVDSEFSNVDRVLWKNKKTGHGTLVYRNTNPTNARDLGTDALISLGMEDWANRFKNATHVAKKAHGKFNGNLHLTGHSLGGSQALHVSNKTGIKATAFNPGFSPADLYREQMTPKDYSNTHTYVVFGDPISNSILSASNLKKTVVMPKSFNTHSMSHFRNKHGL